MSTSMNRLFLTFLFMILLCNGFTQESPFITVKDKVTSNDIKLAKLSISVFVVENIATTTIEMDFFNNTNSVMEGELNFPLGEGVTVSRFALEVNGEMREGVVVEKEKATQVFEAVTSRKVDPGVLEMTKGNNFKARVYPIPAHGFKKAIIAYEQELKQVNNEFIYNLPLDFKQELAKFSVHVEVVKRKPIASSSKNELINLKFDKVHESYISNYTSKNVKLDTHLGFTIPMSDNVKDVMTFKGKVENKDYFYINTQPTKEVREKSKPNKITIVWDASASSKKKSIDKELKLLKNYFQWVGNAKIDLITFSNTIDKIKKFNIKKGDWTELETSLKDINYDGGTQLGCLDFTEINSDEILLFTDAISNFGSKNIQLTKTPVFCINSSSVANLNYLRYIAETTKGYLINLNDLILNDAVQLLTHQNKQFIKAEFSDQELNDVLPNHPTQYNNSFSITGNIKVNLATIKLHFGYANEITETKTYILTNNNPITNNLVERIWVQKKIAELSIHEDENKNEIKAFGKKFSIVTKNTSLIVLDELNDYVQHEIVPPQSLQEEYYKLLSHKITQKKKREEVRLNAVYEMFKANRNWWENVINYNDVKEKSETDIQGNSELTRIASPSSIPSRSYSAETKTITGVVKASSDGLPLPGVNVIVKNTTIGTSTNFDGEFSIVAPLNGVLEISAMGFTTIDVDITNLTNIEVVLQESTVSLDEVVVVALSFSGQVAGLEVVADDVDIESEESAFDSENNNQRTKSSIRINAWDSKAPYMTNLKESKPSELYDTYLSIRDNYSNTPSFFFDVASYMVEMKQKDNALKVISNLSEIELENHEILRSLGRKLSEFGFYKEAIYVFNEVLKIRSFEPQSYRDLGLAYAENSEYQKAIEYLYKVIDKVWDGNINSRFRGVEIIVLHEINDIIKVAKESVDISFMDERFIVNMPVDIRIVIDWDANDTDIDLWITDPLQEKCSYQNKDTRIGGRISNDITTGYGPEEFLLKHAVNGKYKIEANYYGSRKQSVTGPVTVRAFLFTNFGRKNQVCEVLTIQIKDTGRETLQIGDMEFEINKD